MDKIGTGISNQMSARQESFANKTAREEWDARILATGRIPGTRTLGAEFVTTKPKVADK